MKSFCLLSVLSVLSVEVSGHYIFNQLTYAGTVNPVQKYVRPNTNYNSPIIDLTSNNLRCNEGGASGSGTDTLSITAGTSITWASDTAVYHNGPIAAYMAKAPSTAASFDGSGAVWFKIWEKGPTFNPVTWPLSQKYTIPIPAALPNGEYLLRIEQLGLHNPYPAGIPQFYLECSQVTVTGGGSGSPGPLVAIPGHVKGTEQGYTVNIYNQFTAYTMLGPAVWTGGAGGGSPVTTTSRVVTTTAGPVTTTTSRVVTTTPTTTTRVVTTSSTTTSVRTTTTAPSTGGTVPKYGQCGGSGWTGPTACVAGTTCTVGNAFYSQCL